MLLRKEIRVNGKNLQCLLKSNSKHSSHASDVKKDPLYMLPKQPYFLFRLCLCPFLIHQCHFSFIFAVEDSERNDGSAEKPYYMSENLRDILGK